MDKKKSPLLTKIKNIAIILFLAGSFVLAGKNQYDIHNVEKTLAEKPVGVEGTNGNYITPFDQYSYTMRLGWPSNGDGTKDSLLVIDELGRWVRRVKPVSSWLAPYALSSSLSSYATTSSLSGYVPTSRTLSINGTAFDLSANRSWTIPGATYTAGTGLSLIGTTFANTSPDQTVTLTAGNRVSITGSYPNFTVAYIEPTANIVSRTANSNYTISTTKQATVFYSISCVTTNPLLVGTSVGTAFLEYSTNAGTTWNTPTQVSGSSGVGLTVTVALTTGGANTLAGVIPANALVRIRTTTSGTASVTYVTGQETY